MKKLNPLYGEFRGRLFLELLDSAYEYRRYRVDEKTTMLFVDAAGSTWPILHGLETDGMSIPWWLQGIFLMLFWSSPFTGRCVKAVMLHDSVCKSQQVPWQVAHGLMYTAMRADGVGWFRAKVIYRGLMIGGSKW